MNKGIAVMAVLITAWAITACSYITPITSSTEIQRTEQKILEQKIIEENILIDDIPKPIDIQPLRNQPNEWDKSFYADKLSLYGVNESYAIGIINGTDPKYFEEISRIEFIYSSPAKRKNDGWYYPDNKKIIIYVYDMGMEDYYRYLVLHELKHHWCNIHTNNLESTHQGCFLNTPIDKEYGFIK